MNKRAGEAQQYPESDARHHTAKVKQMLDDAMQHARADTTKVKDPRAQALLETTAEVLGGLRKAYDDFERQNEPAWQGRSTPSRSIE
jgi:hypothetical protein